MSRLTTVLKQRGEVVHAEVFRADGECVALFAYVPSDTPIQALADVFKALGGQPTREAPVFRVIDGGRALKKRRNRTRAVVD